MHLVKNYLASFIGYLQDRKQSCFLCGAASRFAICPSCEKDLETNPKRCTSCGIVIKNTNLDYCLNCLQTPQKFSQTYVLYNYEGWVRILIHHFKYQQKLFIGSFFARKVADKIAKIPHNYDAIIPMPLHKKRLQKKGFHQVMELLTKVKNIKIDNISCIRTKPTKELNTLKAKERNKEIKNAFKVVEDMNYKNILIVDDVMTTMVSTIELTKTILKHYKKNNKSAPKIDVLVLART